MRRPGRSVDGPTGGGWSVGGQMVNVRPGSADLSDLHEAEQRSFPVLEKLAANGASELGDISVNDA